MMLLKKLTENRWFSEPKVRNVLLYLYMKANDEPSLWQDRTIERGQLAMTRKVLAEETGLSEYQIKEILKKLVETEEIQLTVIKNKFTIFTLLKYDFYLDVDYKVDISTQNNQIDIQETVKFGQVNLPVTVVPTVVSNLPANPVVPVVSVEPSDFQLSLVDGVYGFIKTQPIKPAKTAKTAFKIPCEKIKEMFNYMFDDVLPSVRFINKDRMRQLERTCCELIKRHKMTNPQDLVIWWGEFFEHILDSDFLCRRVQSYSEGHKNFVATFDWIIKLENLDKIDDGNYNDGCRRVYSKEKQNV